MLSGLPRAFSSWSIEVGDAGGSLKPEMQQKLSCGIDNLHTLKKQHNPAVGVKIHGTQIGLEQACAHTHTDTQEADSHSRKTFRPSAMLEC